MQTVPLRRIVPVGIAGLCCWFAAVLHFEAATLAPSNGLLIGAPPPPTAAFPEAFLVIPGAFAGSPLALTGAIFDIEWLTQTGLIFGACFFWYCVAWHIDSARGILQDKAPPAIARRYLSAMITISVILLPLGILSGLKLGVHSCANGVPPYWVELVDYGMVMLWITIGCYFGWLRYRAARRARESFISLR